MRREERVTVQGPVKEQQPDGMSHRGAPPPPSSYSVQPFYYFPGGGAGVLWAQKVCVRGRGGLSHHLHKGHLFSKTRAAGGGAAQRCSTLWLHKAPLGAHMAMGGETQTARAREPAGHVTPALRPVEVLLALCLGLFQLRAVPLPPQVKLGWLAEMIGKLGLAAAVLTFAVLSVKTVVSVVTWAPSPEQPGTAPDGEGQGHAGARGHNRKGNGHCPETRRVVVVKGLVLQAVRVGIASEGGAFVDKLGAQAGLLLTTRQLGLGGGGGGHHPGPPPAPPMDPRP